MATRRGCEKVKKRKRPRKAKRWLQRRQGSVCPKPRIPFFWFTSIWIWKWPVSVEISAPTRLGLRGSHVRRKFRKRTTLRSESSTLKGLLYAPFQQKQYLKRTTLRRLKIPLRSICSEEDPHYSLSEACVRKLSSDKRQSTFIHDMDILCWFHAWAVLCSLANARKCQLENFCEKERYESCSVRWTFTADAFRRRRKRKMSTIVMLPPDSNERLAFEKPTRSVPKTWGRMYDVLALRK